MSGGEIQRIGLARAFAHAGEARLLILDDAMSSLDTVTEMQVSEALTSQLAGRTGDARRITSLKQGIDANYAGEVILWSLIGWL